MNLSWKHVLGLVVVLAIPTILVAAGAFSGDGSSTGARQCRGLDADPVSCAAGELQRLVADEGVPAAVKSLEGRLRDGELEDSSCHQLTHEIGRAATQEYPTVPAAFRAGTDMCGAGYYHGEMEGIVVELGRRQVVQRISELCEAPRKSRREGIKHYSCAHGLGHGLLGISPSVHGAVSACAHLGDSKERRHCYSGVFMENTRPHGGTGFKKNRGEQRLRHICSTLDGPARSVCYQRLPQDDVFGGDSKYEATLRFCENSPGRARLDCYKGLGALAANVGILKGGDGPGRYALAASLCRLSRDPAEVPLCFQGAAVTFVYNERSLPGAQFLCSQGGAGIRRPCLRVATERLRRLYGGMAAQG